MSDHKSASSSTEWTERWPAAFKFKTLIDKNWWLVDINVHLLFCSLSVFVAILWAASHWVWVVRFDFIINSSWMCISLFGSDFHTAVVIIIHITYVISGKRASERLSVSNRFRTGRIRMERDKLSDVDVRHALRSTWMHSVKKWFALQASKGFGHLYVHISPTGTKFQLNYATSTIMNYILI